MKNPGLKMVTAFFGQKLSSQEPVPGFNTAPVTTQTQSVPPAFNLSCPEHVGGGVMEPSRRVFGATELVKSEEEDAVLAAIGA